MMNTTVRSSELIELEHFARFVEMGTLFHKGHMKHRILLLTILTTLSVQISQHESLAADLTVLSSIRGITIQQSYPGMPRLDYSKMPWLDYSKLPWLKDFPRPQPYTVISAAGLLANLKA